ncbi:hypothetical protein BN946_scf185028.g14 [Trametes cinnabarina]|uniref:RRM domain-containing protein n=1 Tax=Pycnoporus cinnabarinus TaxID=5643 RepID=A0A060SWA1_PYCCI|nr:hypothetical protein BN946_scf185028.g14 [Trametes cinnabarina]
MPRILFVSGFHPSTRARDLAYEFERYGPLVRCDVPAPRNPRANSNPRVASIAIRTASTQTPHVAPQHVYHRRRLPESIRRRIVILEPHVPLALVALRTAVDSIETPVAQRLPLFRLRSYAFVEFRSQRDAEDAYYDMHGRIFEGARLSIQWAKNPPSSVWRYERRSPPPSRRDRSRSPRRRSDRDRDYDRDRGYDRDRDRDRDFRDRDRDREREPRGDRDDRDKERGDERRRRSRSPERRRSASPERRKDDRARTPPPLEEEAKKEEDREREHDRAQTPPRDY